MAAEVAFLSSNGHKEEKIPSPIQDDPRLAPLPVDVLDQYLAILAVERRECSLATLRALVSSHVTRIPFENISKLYYYKRLGLTDLPGIRMYLEGIESKHFGGTCYSNNYYFHLLLRSLGFEAKLCAADMRNPHVHAVNMIMIEGREYLVDTGYAAPLLEPIPRDLKTDYEIALGRDRYVLKPQDGNGCSRLQLYRDGVLRHGYLAKPTPRKIEDFTRVIRESFSQNATFLNAVLLARFHPHSSTVIHNFTLIESEGDKSTVYELADRDELIATVEKQFAIPSEVVSEAIRGLGSLQSAWS